MSTMGIDLAKAFVLSSLDQIPGLIKELASKASKQQLVLARGDICNLPNPVDELRFSFIVIGVFF